MMKLKQYGHILMLCGLGFGLGACVMNVPSRVGTDKIQIEQETFEQTIPVAALSDRMLRQIADTYHRRGKGQVNLTVTYVDDKADALRNAQASMNDLLVRLEDDHQVRNVVPVILPLSTGVTESMAYISFQTLHARAPDECFGPEGTNQKTELYESASAFGYNMGSSLFAREEEYIIGCDHKRIMAEQAAYPEDLLGRDAFDPQTGRRAYIEVESYQQGGPEGELGGYTVAGD